MKRDEADKLWADQSNWKYGCIYVCPTDPRVVVPKRNPWLGWTCNFAHSSSWAVILLFVVVAVGPLFFAIFSGVESVPVILLIAILSGVGIWLIARLLERRGIE